MQIPPDQPTRFREQSKDLDYFIGNDNLPEGKKVKVKPPSSKILDEALRRPKFTISGPSAI